MFLNAVVNHKSTKKGLPLSTWKNGETLFNRTENVSEKITKLDSVLMVIHFCTSCVKKLTNVFPQDFYRQNISLLINVKPYVCLHVIEFACHV